MHRVEELADRPEGFVPEDAVPCKDLIPLTEIICSIHRIDTLYSRTAWDIYMKLIDKFENEFNVLLNVPEEELEKVVSKNLVEAIIKVREGKVKIIPGFDGVYGKPVFDEFEFKRYEEKQKNVKIHSQKRLIDFKGL